VKPLRVLGVAAAILCLGMALPCRAEEPKPETGFVDSLLEKAQEYIGTPYRYGGTTPKGFDCSGFVRFVFGSFGINLNRSSVSQAAQGDAIDLGQIQPGDLLFFKTKGQQNRISHVGIYLGGGQFIHAGSWGGPGKRGVKIGQLDSTYYANRLVSARRLMLAPGETPQVLDQLMQGNFLKQDKGQ
jgi:cell wall-associated NlpC family hydrolase